MTTVAESILAECVEVLHERGKQRDVFAERSMAAAVEIASKIGVFDLGEYQGWMFMVALKLARMRRGGLKKDDYVDAINYLALAYECKFKEVK